MKQTKIVTDTDSDSFNERVDKLTVQGWKIIPDTLKIAVSTSSNWNYGHRTARSFAVILEKE